jgi:hypothetical protein
VQRAPYEYRADPAVPGFADERFVIVFDGKCVLCSSFAQFILRKIATLGFACWPHSPNWAAPCIGTSASIQ